MKKILLSLALLFLFGCSYSTLGNYEKYQIQERAKNSGGINQYFALVCPEQNVHGADVFPKDCYYGWATNQSEANRRSLESCSYIRSDCVVIKENNTWVYSKQNAKRNKEYQDERMRTALKEAEEQEKSKKLYERETRRKYLEDNFGSKCSTNKANNVEYNKCLNDQEQIAKKEKAIQEAKQAEENKKKQLIAEKQKAEEDKLNKMLANMKPEERRAYVCEKTYGLRKGSDKFSECVYKILAADIELEKLELQKKLAEAQLETARANEAAARANAAASASRGNVSSYDPNVAAAMDRANEIERAKILLNLSQALRTPPASPQFNAPPRQQNCKLNPYNNRITCY